jgi:hypothetical protein
MEVTPPGGEPHVDPGLYPAPANQPYAGAARHRQLAPRLHLDGARQFDNRRGIIGGRWARARSDGANLGGCDAAGAFQPGAAQ